MSTSVLYIDEVNAYPDRTVSREGDARNDVRIEVDEQVAQRWLSVQAEYDQIQDEIQGVVRMQKAKRRAPKVKGSSV